MVQPEFDSLEELNNIVNFRNKRSLVIILGETKNLYISRHLYSNTNLDLVTIDPCFESMMKTKTFTKRVPKKIRDSIVPMHAERTRIRNILLKHGSTFYECVILVSFNAHTHLGKFYDRVCTSAPKVFDNPIIAGIGSDCHYPGFHKRHISKTLLYPKSRRDRSFSGGWVKDIHLSYKK